MFNRDVKRLIAINRLTARLVTLIYCESGFALMPDFISNE